MTNSKPKRRGHKNHYTNIVGGKIVYQKYIKTSSRVGYTPPICKRSQVQRPENSRLTVRGAKIRALSPLRRFEQTTSYSPTTVLVRLQCARKDLYKAVEGTKHKTYRPVDDHWVILSTSRLTFFEPDETKLADPLSLLKFVD